MRVVACKWKNGESVAAGVESGRRACAERQDQHEQWSTMWREAAKARERARRAAGVARAAAKRRGHQREQAQHGITGCCLFVFLLLFSLSLLLPSVSHLRGRHAGHDGFGRLCLCCLRGLLLHGAVLPELLLQRARTNDRPLHLMGNVGNLRSTENREKQRE